MECVNCDCTVKTMNNLDCAIRGLLQRGKHVNQMMKEEKLIRDERKMEALKELKKQLPTTKKVIQCSEATMDRTVTNSTKPRRIFNKITGKAESIDFDCPSLTTEQSETTVCSSGPYTSASLSIPKKTSSVVSTTTMTTEVVATSSIYIKQNPVDMSLDMHLVFFDDQNQKVMDISMNSSQNKKISNVQFCGKDAKIVA
ncbi:Protein CBG21510 [Caenorhabditis briggsae]|uniref:Protein CBG21510 n=1 Tax=Caenorhabditis briggsae TaxID=6238 RepID=A8Y0A2_CAEBR|nr:Protein CBG21510 [Caenorhabditis briggsae]CAP38287.2 Protein CBG21510 [Caenorhabditis briggsae]